MLLAGVSLDDINSETARRFTDHSAAAFAKATDDATDPVHRAVRAVRELLAGRESGVWASAGREEHAIQLIVNAYPAAWTAAESLSTYKYLVGSAAHEIPIPQARTREARTAALLKLADVGLTLAEVQRRAPPIPPVPPGGLVQLPGVRTTDPQAEALATSAAA